MNGSPSFWTPSLVTLTSTMTLDGLWKATRDTLLERLPLHSVTLYLNYFDIEGDFKAIHHQTTPGCLLPWKQRRRFSPTPQFLQQNRKPTFFRLQHVLPGQRLSRTPYFQEVMEPENWSAMVSFPFWSRGTVQGLLTLRRNQEQGEFSQEDIQSVLELYPILRSGLRRIANLQKDFSKWRCLERALEGSPSGVVLLDFRNQIHFANSKARKQCLDWNYGPSQSAYLDPQKAFQIPVAIQRVLDEMRDDWRGGQGRMDQEKVLFREIENPLEKGGLATIEMLRPPEMVLANPHFLIRFEEKGSAPDSACSLKASPMHASSAILTPKEKEVVHLVCKGFDNQRIGQILGKSPKTVKAQLTSCYEKLEVESRSQLISVLLKPS